MALYITFILAGSLLFAFVYFYSIRSQRAKRAKMDQRLDKMVVDEMLKPTNAESKQPSQSMGSNIAPAAAETVADANGLKGSDVINVPVFDDDVKNDDVAEILNPNSLREEPSIGLGQAVSKSDSVSHQPEFSTGSAMQPRSVTEEPAVSPGQAVETADVGSTVQTDSQGQTSLFKEKGSDQVSVDPVVKKPAVNKPLWDDRECELVAKILGENAVSRDEVLATFRKYDFLLARKLHIFGFNTLTQMWSDVEREDISAVFTDLGVSVQLADKSGALTRKELNTVSQLVLDYSESLDRTFSFSMDLDDAIEIGRELDELGRRHSSMVVLNIVPKRKDGFRSSDVDSCTRDLNMSQSEQGVFTRYQRANNRSNTLYHVAVADEKGEFRPVKKQSPFRVHDIVIYLNVPTVESPSDAFSNMVDESRKLATWLDGKLVDKHHRNMTTKGVNLLKSQVAEIETNMRNDGIAPGGALSHKLF